MVVKEGYKNTEVGVIPEDWEVIRFDEAFYFLSTASYSRAELSEKKDIKYVHYGDIHTRLNHFLDFEKNELPTIIIEQLKTYSLIREGDLIMADASEDYEGIGKSVEVKNIRNDKAISGLHTFLLRGKDNVFSNGFKAYLHSNRIIKNQYDKLATGLKVYGVSKGNLKQILIPLPTLPEQTAIATVLSDTDNLIQALEKKIAKKELIKKGAMQELLEPKEGWEEVLMPEVCWFQEGPGVRNSQFTNSGVKLLNGTNIEKGKLLLEKTERYISNEEAYGWYSHFLVDDGDILIACSGVSIEKFHEKVTFAENKHLPLCMNTSTMRFKIKSSNLAKDFLFHFLKSNSFKEQIGGKATGSAQLNFGPSHVSKVFINMPSIEEQTKNAQILSDMDNEIESLQEKLSKYKQLKQGLMQELLTGRIRLV